MFSKIILTCLLVGVLLVGVLGRTLCPEIILTPNMTLEEVTLKNLALNAPVDCVCRGKNAPDKWIIRGNAYDLGDRPVCVAQPTGKDIKPNEGERCPMILIGKSTETMFQFWTRLHDTLTDAPFDGWCPPGTQKWIHYGSAIGKERDTCVCAKDHYWVEM